MSAFAPGERVRIAATPTVGHSRVPSYVRGHAGTIERVLPEFLIPEDEAWQRLDGRREVLYRVRLPQRELWPDDRSATADVLEIEMFEHWLEPVSEEDRHAGH